MSADAGADQRAMTALQERADRADAEIVKLKGRLDSLSLRVRALEGVNTPSDALPADPMERAHKGLTDAMGRVPIYTDRLTQSEVAARKRLTDVE